jgi:hypothetical protein
LSYVSFRIIQTRENCATEIAWGLEELKKMVESFPDDQIEKALLMGRIESGIKHSACLIEKARSY